MVYLIDPGRWSGLASSYVGAVIDSASIDAEGYFVFEELPDTDEPIVLQLAVQRKGERFLNRLDNDDPATSNYFPIIWQTGQKLKLTAEVEQLQESLQLVDPDAQNAAVIRLRDIRSQAYQEYLEVYYATTEVEEDLLELEDAVLRFQRTLMHFAEESPDLLPALMAIRWLNHSYDFERVAEFVVAQSERWQQEAPEHPWVVELSELTAREKMPVLIGDFMPNYPLPMLGGDTIPLRALLSEKLTLIDLWASWCAPCRVQNRDYLVPLWDEYRTQGFGIIAYGLESSSAAWVPAIQADGAFRWQHASHLQGDDSPFFERLRISTIPANFLLDADGRIVAKNLHSEELVEFVKTWLE